MSKDHLSFSAINGFMECEARQKALDDGLWEFKESQGMLEGRLLEAILCNDAYPAGTTKKDGSLYAWAKGITETANRMKKDRLIEEFLLGEYQKKYEFEFDGINYISIPDIVNDKENRIVDIKKTTSLLPQYSQKFGTRVMFYTERNYFLQLALAWHVRGRKDRCYLMAATSENPGDFIIYELSMADMSIALDDVLIVHKHILDVRTGVTPPMRCEKCDYCRSTKIGQIAKAERFLDA